MSDPMFEYVPDETREARLRVPVRSMPDQCDEDGVKRWRTDSLASPSAAVCYGCPNCAWRKIKQAIPHFDRRSP